MKECLTRVRVLLINLNLFFILFFVWRFQSIFIITLQIINVYHIILKNRSRYVLLKISN